MYFGLRNLGFPPDPWQNFPDSLKLGNTFLFWLSFIVFQLTAFKKGELLFSTVLSSVEVIVDSRERLPNLAMRSKDRTR